jgi:hypothetical protein
MLSPMISPHAIWWRAVHQAAPAVEYAEFVGLSGAAAELPVCAPGCDCRLRHALALSARKAVESCGLRVTALASGGDSEMRARRRVETALRRKSAVVWQSDSRDELALLAVREDGALMATRCGGADDLICEVFTEIDVDFDTQRGGEFYGLSRSTSPRGPRSRRELKALLEWIASAFRPPTTGGCRIGGPLQQHGGGIAACDLWAAIADAETSGRFARRAAVWREAKEAGALWLRQVAGRGRSRLANRVRAAADALESEVDLCWRNSGVARTDRIERIQSARAWARESAILLAEAAFARAGLPSHAIAALLEEPSERLDGIALNEVIYLARASIRPLRELAARRLAGALAASATSALIQLLYDDDGPVASTALWSLARQPMDRLVDVLLSAARNGQRARTDLDYPFTRTLLGACVELDGASGLQDFRIAIAVESPDSPLIGDIDAVLSAPPVRQP